MNIKKMFVSMIVAALVIPMFANYSLVSAEEAPAPEYIDDEVIEDNIIESETLDNGLEVEVTENTQNEVVLQTEHTVGETEVDVNIEMDKETEDINVSGEVIDENGESIYQNYDVIVHDVEGDKFIATFIDTESGDMVEVDTTQMTASALPIIIVAAVARYGISYAIKKYGKKAAQNAVKSKSYGKVLTSVSRLDANKRKHILAGKHNWGKVTGNNWSDVSKVMSHVMREGKESAYKKVRKKTLKMSGKTVTVTFTRKNGKVYISNGWVS